MTFLTALYAERVLSHIADYLLRAIGRVLERQSSKDAATLEEVEAALAEDEAVWSWVKGMRVRAYVDAELAKERLRSGGPVQGAFASPLLRTSTTQSARNSIDSVGSSARGLLYGGGSRKGDTGDAFEQLMQSGKTMKVSLTPDRLRTADVSSWHARVPRPMASCLRGTLTLQKLDRSRNTLTPSSSVPTLATAPAAPTAPSLPSPAASPSQPKRRLQARAPRDQIAEDEEEEQLDAASIPGTPPVRKNPKGESLMELLNSPPPWPENEEKFVDPAAAPVARAKTMPSRRGSKAEASAQDGTANGRVGPRSASMQQQASYHSVASVGSAFSSGSEVEAWLNLAPEERAKMLQIKPKDEREDLAHERQINHDLVDFFAAPPPTAAESLAAASLRSDDRRQSFQSTATARSTASLMGNGVPKKKSGGFLGFMRSKDKASAPPAPAPPPQAQAQPQRVVSRSQSQSQPASKLSQESTPEPDGWPTYAKGRRSSSSDPSTKPPTKYRTEVDPARAQAAAARAAALAGGYSPAMGSVASAAYSPPGPRRHSHARSDSLRSEMVSPMTGAVQLPPAVPEAEAAPDAFAGGERVAGPPKTPADFDPNERSATPATNGAAVVHGLGIVEDTGEGGGGPASEASVSDAGSKKMRRKANGANGIVIGPRTAASGGDAAPVTGEAQGLAMEEDGQTAQPVDSTPATSSSPFVDAPSSAPESDVEDNLEPAPHKAQVQPTAGLDPASARERTMTPPPRSLHRVDSPTPSNLRSSSRQSIVSPARFGPNGTPASVKKPEVSLTSTLLALRVGMVSARTAEECLALLDQLLWHSTNEERGRGEGEEAEELAGEPEAGQVADDEAKPTPVGPTEPATVSGDAPSDEAAHETPNPEEAALFEYFLGGSTVLPPKEDTATSAEAVAAEHTAAAATEPLEQPHPADKAGEEPAPQVVVSVDERDTVHAAPEMAAGPSHDATSRSVTPVPPGGFA